MVIPAASRSNYGTRMLTLLMPTKQLWNYNKNYFVTVWYLFLLFNNSCKLLQEKHTKQWKFVVQLLSKSLLYHVLAHDMYADFTHNSFQSNNIMFMSADSTHWCQPNCYETTTRTTMWGHAVVLLLPSASKILCWEVGKCIKFWCMLVQFLQT